MARRSNRVRQVDDGVAIAVNKHPLDVDEVSRGLSLAPAALAGPAVKRGQAGRTRGEGHESVLMDERVICKEDPGKAQISPVLHGFT